MAAEKRPQTNPSSVPSAAQCWSHWLFRRVYFAPREKTIDASKHIAANPDFNRHVGKVAYDGRLIQEHYLESEMYERAYSLYA